MKEQLNNIRISINSFSWKQMWNNSQGKTDAALWCGFWGSMVSLGGLVMSGTIMLILVVFKIEYLENVPDYLGTLATQCVIALGLSTGLLGVASAVKDKPIMTEDTSQQFTMNTEKTPGGEKTKIVQSVESKTEGEV